MGQFSVKSHHNLAATNERLLAGVPLTLGLLSFENELKVFDNASGESISQKSVSQFIGTLNSITIDQQNNRVFIAFDNKIAPLFPILFFDKFNIEILSSFIIIEHKNLIE